MGTFITTSRAVVPVALAVALGAAAGGCDVFDPELYLSRSAVALSDRCERDVPAVASSEAAFTIDTSVVAADYQDFYGCIRRQLPGNEGFMRIDTVAGEKWHVHVEPQQSELDPALYFLPSCDLRTCEMRTANDACGPGRPEHLSFVSTGGPYLVGIDSRQPGGGRYSVIVTRPVCGNGGQMEHSEACDDGNTVSGDRCDSLCRVELSGPAVMEKESNEMPAEANVISGAAAMTVNARMGDHCGDADVFAVTVPAGGALPAQLVHRAGRCAGQTTTLSVLAPDGITELGRVDSDGEACPVLDQRHAFARALPAGQYYLRVTSDAVDPFDYQLKLEGR
jgi:cysteine-rich repeat protein